LADSHDFLSRSEPLAARSLKLFGSCSPTNLLDRQFFATFGATTLENEATFVGSHASAEAVDTDAFGFFGLEGSFRHVDILAGERGFVTVGDSNDRL